MWARFVAAGCVLAVSTLPAVAAEMDNMILSHASVERLEYRVQDGDDVGFVEGDLVIGNDDHKVVLGIEAERSTGGGQFESSEVHLLYRRPISDFFDVQGGVRHDLAPDPETTHLVLGLTGLLEQWVEFEGNAYLSDDGDVSFRTEIETEIFLTRRTFVQPLVELDISASENQAREIGSGFSKIEAGLRFHYVVTGGLNPYIGVNYEAKLGETADFARADGEDTDATAFVAGVRFAY
ncbi:Copper resistance protein B [Candidatus Phaeomarinobacter ectocarpi]|uniref:Copper resistance protein B n=1 Tax=Candidatus Phaeomarinibacter ectocarpi TaxID=1458461 RepID=X5MK94_9HYPH|nr:copper resistance protein B [Candidatus Phaeomarinobacter ectocarpi]CDO58365.1 Copper resistance protein B [Candidatus Phaeomarinobacter ectocarpi]